MKHPFRLAAAVTVASLAVLPASASAHQPPSPKTVAQHARSADKALDKVASLVSRNRDAAAAIELARNRREGRLADREAARLARSPRGSRGVTAATQATHRVARLHDRGAEVLAGTVAEADGGLQVDMAKAVGSELQGREKALSVLAGLTERLPQEAREGIARAIAALSSDGADETASLVQAVESGKLSPQAAAAVQQALERALSAIDSGVERLRSMVERLPEEARPLVDQALRDTGSARAGEAGAPGAARRRRPRLGRRRTATSRWRGACVRLHPLSGARLLTLCPPGRRCEAGGARLLRPTR
ncbi:MAG: hypothetical protein M3133_00505 [Actinomycetota bacterium]|nr:hypothetical protein [Actinomycetota bacterium]